MDFVGIWWSFLLGASLGLFSGAIAVSFREWTLLLSIFSCLKVLLSRWFSFSRLVGYVIVPWGVKKLALIWNYGTTTNSDIENDLILLYDATSFKFYVSFRVSPGSWRFDSQNISKLTHMITGHERIFDCCVLSSNNNWACRIMLEFDDTWGVLTPSISATDDQLVTWGQANPATTLKQTENCWATSHWSLLNYTHFSIQHIFQDGIQSCV